MNACPPVQRVNAPDADMMSRVVAEAALGSALDKLRDVCAERHVHRQMVWAAFDWLRTARCEFKRLRRRYYEAIGANQSLRQQNAELLVENQRLCAKLRHKNVKPATVSPARASRNHHHRNDSRADSTTYPSRH